MTCTHVYSHICVFVPLKLEASAVWAKSSCWHVACRAHLHCIPGTCAVRCHRIRQFILMMWLMVGSCAHFWGLKYEYPSSLTQVSRAYRTHLTNILDGKAWWSSCLVIFLVIFLVLSFVVIRKIKGIHAT